MARRSRQRIDAHSLELIAAGLSGSVAAVAAWTGRRAIAVPAAGVAAAVPAAMLVSRVRDARARHARQAVDELTGLGSRRALENALDRVCGGNEAATFAVFELGGFKKYNDAYGHDCGDALLRRIAARLAVTVAPNGRAYRPAGPVFAVLLPAGQEPGPASVADALFEMGEGFMIHPFWGAVEIPADAATRDAVLRIADRRLYADRTDPSRAEPALPLLAPIPRVPAPRYDVAALARAVARQLGLTPDQVEEIEAAAQLRDVGNMALPASLLQREGPLSEDERRFVELHTLVGERLLGDGFALTAVAAIVRSSHERWDGAGYPDGLAGEAILLAARIIFVCTAFEDMTSERSYRPALSEDEALAELRRCAGTQFDPSVVAAFAPAIRPAAVAA